MRKGFTLIELLIVVAIIAILAAIAVPNFLEAQTRSRVSRAQNDLRTISLAMESYYVDNGTYPVRVRDSPRTGSTASATDQTYLTSPISYLSAVPKDVFRQLGKVGDTNYVLYGGNYGALTDGSFTFSYYPYNAWMTHSIGPDLWTNTASYRSYKWVLANEARGEAGNYGFDADGNRIGTGGGGTSNGDGLRYDPTNGTTSFGDIHRWEGMAKTGPAGPLL